MSGSPISLETISSPKARLGRMGARLLAVVAEGARERI